MNFNDELEKFEKSQKQYSDGCRDLEELTEEELRLATQEIQTKYLKRREEQLKELKENYEKYDDFCKVIASYSKFDDKVIGLVLADLISIFEGTPYVYQEADYNSTQVQRLAFDFNETKVQTRLKLVVAEECKTNSYSDSSNNPTMLSKDGKALILADEAHGWKSSITFYYANPFQHELRENVNFERFLYVKEFIDILISYKIENKTDRISQEILSQLEREFIASRVEQIEERYRLVEQQKEEQMKLQLKKECENRQLRLNKVLNKK